MDKTQFEKLHSVSEEVFSASLKLEADSKERDLLFCASQLIEMAIEIMEEQSHE